MEAIVKAIKSNERTRVRVWGGGREEESQR